MAPVFVFAWPEDVCVWVDALWALAVALVAGFLGGVVVSFCEDAEMLHISESTDIAAKRRQRSPRPNRQYKEHILSTTAGSSKITKTLNNLYLVLKPKFGWMFAR